MATVQPYETLPYEVWEERLQEAVEIAGMWDREANTLNFREPKEFARVSAALWRRRAEHIAPNVKHLSPDGLQITAEIDREMALFEPDA